MDGVSRWFVVRDLGASLGKFTYPTLLKWFRVRGFGQGTRNDLPGFEEQGFIERIDGDSVEFDYKGIYRDFISTVTPAHVRWACERLSTAIGSAVELTRFAAADTRLNSRRGTRIRSRRRLRRVCS